MPPRDTLLEIIQADIAGIHGELKAINGRLTKSEIRIESLDDEVYGNPDRRIEGIKVMIQDFHDIKVAAKAILWFLGFVGVGNLTALVVLWSRLGI